MADALADTTQQFSLQLSGIIKNLISQLEDTKQKVNSQILTTGVKKPKRKAAGTAGKVDELAEMTQRLTLQLAGTAGKDIAETQTDEQIAVVQIGKIAQWVISEIADMTKQLISKIATTCEKSEARGREHRVLGF